VKNFELFEITLDPTISSNIIRFLQKKDEKILNKDEKTLRKIGELMDLSESYISYVKKGERGLKLKRLLLLEKSLNMPLTELFMQSTKSGDIPKNLRHQYEQLLDIIKLFKIH
jgi:transcriptional regulator with XRE-family HTH domain